MGVLTASFLLVACGGNNSQSSESSTASVPFALPLIAEFEEYIQNIATPTVRDDLTLEVVTYEVVTAGEVENRPSIVLLVDVAHNRIGQGGFYRQDQLDMMAERYVLRIVSWLQTQRRYQAEYHDTIAARIIKEDPFIVVVVGVDDVTVGSSTWNSDTREVIWTVY